MGKNGYVMILDERGRVLVSPSRQSALTPLVFEGEAGRAMLDTASSDQSGSAWVELYGQRSLVVSAPAKELGWTALAVMPFGEYRRPLAQARYLVFSVIFITLVGVFWVSVRASRTLTGPLGRLTRMAGAMAKGDFSVTASVESHDEVGDLALSFNRMREGLLRSHAVLEAVVECGRVMLSVADFDRAVNLSLRALCLGADVNRAFVFEKMSGAGKNMMVQRNQWTKEMLLNATGRADSREVIGDDMGYGRWLERFGAGQPILGSVADFPEGEREFLLSRGALSVLAFPIYCEGALWGFLGIEDCVRERSWQDGEQKALQAAAGIFGGAILRRETLTSLLEERDKLERISRGGGIGMAVISPDCRVAWSNRVFSEFFGESADAVCLQAFAGLPGQGPKRIFEQGTGQDVFEVGQRDAAGEMRWFQVTATPLRSEQGETVSAALVFAPITERKQAEMEVMDARKAAEEGDRAKRIFMDTMGHELRTPLTAVLGFSDVMTYMGLSDEQRECVEGIKDAGRALLAIIDDILDLVRIESGGDALVEREFPLLSILASAAATFRGQAQAQGLELHLEAADDIPARLIGDPVRLRQILLKLLDNAVKFTAAGQVTLRCELISGAGAGPGTVSLRFSVSDTGPGIPSEKLAAIFERFTQADGSLSRQFGGIGVGLSIVHKLVEGMGGRMRVDSVPDKGSTFAFTAAFNLPAKNLDYRPPGPPRPTVKILVLDESPLYRMHMRLILEKSGRMALTAESTSQALEALSGQACDAVLLDVASAGATPRETVARLRAGAAGMPILALVQEPDEAAVQELLAAGFDGVVKKPATLAKLVAALDAAFKARGKLAA